MFNTNSKHIITPISAEAYCTLLPLPNGTSVMLLRKIFGINIPYQAVL